MTITGLGIGRIEWRHERDDPSAPGIVGECYAGHVQHLGWYVVWSSDSRSWLGGGSWATDLACFTALDENAVTILEFVSPRRADQWPSSPWGWAMSLELARSRRRAEREHAEWIDIGGEAG